MDVFYHVKQTMLEISTLETQLREKKTAMEKLLAVLTPQEKLLLDLQEKPEPPKPKKT